MMVLRKPRLLGDVSGVVEHLRDAEVSELDSSVLHEENVLALEVSVDDLPIVYVFDSETHLREPLWISKENLESCFRRRAVSPASAF